MTGSDRVLYVIVCAAGPAGQVDRLITIAHDRGWQVQVIATPAALDFIDTDRIERLTGTPIRTGHRKPGNGQRRSLSPADAIIVAPATYNTINKFALGVSDTYALGVLAEAPGLGIPAVVLPFVNAAYAVRHPFQRSIAGLRAEGIRVLYGPGEFEPHPPGTGGTAIDAFPWRLALDEAERLADQV